MKHSPNSRTFLLLPWLLIFQAQPLLAQQDDAAQGQSVATVDRSRILYIDVPIAIVPGEEPVLPEPGFLTSPLENKGYQDRAEVIDDYAEQIAAIEGRGGVWDQKLVEELAALGALQQQQGQHLEATETLGRALHVNRINSGLNAIDQVPIVEQLIDSYLALGDWANVDLYQNYLYYVQRRAYGGGDPRLIPVLNDLGQWNMEAFNLGFGEPLGIRLSSAQLLFDTAARMVGMHFGSQDARYVPYLRNIASSAYLVAQYPDFIRELDGPEYRASHEAFKRQLGRDRLLEPRGFSAGRDALAAIVEHYRQQTGAEYELARALANLADWQLLFERYNRSDELYAEAWQIVAEMDNSEELLGQLFGQVIPIPTFAQLPTNLLIGASDGQDRHGLHQDYADVRLDVSENGAPRRVEVITEETEANDRQLSRLRREVRNMTFRPLIVGGEPRDSEGHMFRYRYWY